MILKGKSLNVYMLPTNNDVICALLDLRTTTKSKIKNYSRYNIQIAKQIHIIWESCSIETINYPSILRKVKKLLDTYNICLKTSRNNVKYVQFVDKNKILFEIAKNENNLDKETHTFLIDQRGQRKLNIANTIQKNGGKFTC